VTTVVRTLAITTSRDVDVIRRWTKTGTYGKTSLIGMLVSASTGALLIERYMKTCDASSTMQLMAPSLKQFSSHLRQVVWPRNFKLEKLKKYDGKENPENFMRS